MEGCSGITLSPCVVYKYGCGHGMLLVDLLAFLHSSGFGNIFWEAVLGKRVGTGSAGGEIALFVHNNDKMKASTKNLQGGVVLPPLEPG